jgi:hypothetical protein
LNQKLSFKKKTPNDPNSPFLKRRRRKEVKEDPTRWPMEGSNVWWPLKGSNVWWPMKGFNAWWLMKRSNVWWPLKGSNVWWPMEGKGEAPFPLFPFSP